MYSEVVVAQDGSGDFARVGDALQRAESLPPGPLTIRIRPGVYREKLKLIRPGLSLVGSGAESTRLVFGDHAHRAFPNGEIMGTFNSYALYVGAPDVRVEGLCVENDAGDGRVVGPAVALYADADRLSFANCAFRARQDTICSGPLPKDPAPKGVNLAHPVAGLGEDEPKLPFRQAYRCCLVEGDVDFIFGSAAALFSRCEIRTLGRGGDDTYIAAPSTYPGQGVGFVFDRCRLTYASGRPGPARGRAFLGRPWRSCARAVFAHCELGAHVDPAGWDDWGKSEAREKCYFGELGSTGPGARPGSRAAWSRRPSEAEFARMIEAIRF